MSFLYYSRSLRPRVHSPVVYFILLSFFFSHGVLGHPHTHFYHRRSRVFHAETPEPISPKSQNTCVNEEFSFFDYSVKQKPIVAERVAAAPTCPAGTLLGRAVQPEEDYSCSETRPCKNGACCSKATGYCNYGPEACGTNGQSPNDVCWSNCNAKAACGKYADPPGKTCPLNVCCSKWGFCGIDNGQEFCSSECQSNCVQPGSGGSGGNVQSKVIGYYEAWNVNKKCTGMNLNQIPAGSLTHAMFSFAFINPGDFKLIPMDGIPESLFTDFTGIKRRNPGLKAMIAVGGWTHNDPGPFQPVFSDMVATSASRRTFIANLFSFLRQHSFDGVDFDWEYPTAVERGGRPNDGPNFTAFLRELRDAISREPVKYVVSFTVPTSFWYLRGFDLKALDYADFMNVMSYDLHGTWDADNPIGARVYAHTNLTEIKLALDLLWRNKVNPSKVNLGLGFYGRSFQLANPSCTTPGCPFLGGASPGPCTETSGILSYKEITEIIQSRKLTPIYDVKEAVKYIVWDRDQWVSYDDAETIKRKIDFANNLGLGGLLIWAIDLDTPDLKALKGVVAPKALNVFAAQTDDAAYWNDVSAASCYDSGCNNECNSGFISIWDIGCGGNKKRKICCPISSAPDPKECTWRGNHPACNGQCHAGELTMTLDKNGGGGYCTSGHKMLCCKVANANSCYWKGDFQCKSGDVQMTWRGPYGIPFEVFCCPPDDAANYKDCNWKGSGRCDSNHCDLLTEVQLTTSYSAEGKDCGLWDRKRAFCCKPTTGRPLFLPVPLDRLFPNPPTGSGVSTDFTLELEDTWGKGSDQTPNVDSENTSTFVFVVLASPEELQISLDRRDGTHWQIYNCDKTESEEPQTIQMFCTDLSPESNCGKINLGHGPVGTIVELPPNCGPGKYAVVKTMDVAENQTVPHHLVKRAPPGHVIYDLTFDYDFRRVPRDLGETQMRVDFSNQEGYWDSIVAKAAGTKKRRKRSLEDLGSNHKRWLEEEWRDDLHFGGLSREDLHKRWFGSDIVDWIRRLVTTGVSTTVAHTHTLEEDFTAILVQERLQCPIGGVNVEANLDVRCNAKVTVDTSFGITIITKLDFDNGLDLSKSFLFFKNKGSVTAGFSLDARVSARFASGDVTLIGLSSFPGLTITVPGILTLGPDFKLNAAIEAEITIDAHVDANIQLANWDMDVTFPIPNGDYNPKPRRNPDPNIGQLPLQPTVNGAISASGQITAHLKPTITFGISWAHSEWGVPNCKVDLVADGWVRLHAKAEASTGGNCPFSWGVDGGASILAKVDAPPQFGWGLASNPWTIARIPDRRFPVGSSCPATRRVRSIDAGAGFSQNDTALAIGSISERGPTIGPPFHFGSRVGCPADGTTATDCQQLQGMDRDDDSDVLPSNSKRDYLSDNSTSLHLLSERDLKHATICSTRDLRSSDFRNSGSEQGLAEWWNFEPDNCDNFVFENVKPNVQFTADTFATEHLLEFHLLQEFWNRERIKGLQYPNPNAAVGGMVSFCVYFRAWWTPAVDLLIPGQPYNQITVFPYPAGKTSGPRRQGLNPAEWVGYMFPSHNNPWHDEFVLLEKAINRAKESLWKNHNSFTLSTLNRLVENVPRPPKYPNGLDNAIKIMRQNIGLWRYHSSKSAIIKRQADRIATIFGILDSPAGMIHTIPGVTYTSMGLQASWNTFMKQRFQAVIDRHSEFLDTYADKLVDYANNNPPQPNGGGISQIQLNRINNIRLLATIKPAWTNPYP